MKRICFVCHGNICRSVAAKYIAKDHLAKAGKLADYEIFSRALSYEEIGNDIYPPMKRALMEQGIPFGHHHAAILTSNEYRSCDAIYYMDDENAMLLRRMFGPNDGRCIALADYLPDADEIADPWYSGRFDEVVDQLKRCVKAIFPR